MADAVRDAKLVLRFDTLDARKSAEEFERDGDKMRAKIDETVKAGERLRAEIDNVGNAWKSSTTSSAAGAAQSIIDRFGESELSKSEAKRPRRKTAEERAAEREVRFQVKDIKDALALKRKGEEEAKAKAEEEVEFGKAFSDEQGVLEAAARNKAKEKRKAKRKEEAKFKEKFENEQVVLEHEASQKAAAERDEIRSARFKDQIRGTLHDRGLIDARSDYQKRRDAEGEGDNSGMMGMVGRFAPLGYGLAAQRFMQLGTTTLNSARNSDLTAAQGANMVLDEIPGVRSLREFSRALDGTTEQVRKANVKLDRETQLNAVRAQNRAERMGLELSRDQARNRADVLGSAVVPTVQQFDRTSLTGEIAHQEEQARVAARDAVAEAEREAQIARRNAASASAQIPQLDREHERSQAQLRRASQQLGRVMAGERTGLGGRNAGGRQTFGVDLELGLQQEQTYNEQRNRLVRASGDAAVAASQAEARARQANIDAMKTELQILQQREQRLTGAASRLGGMNYIDRAMGLQASRMVREQGIGNVTAEIRGRAESFDPEFYRHQAQQFGQNTAEYRQWRQETPGAFGVSGTDTIAQNREAQMNLQQSIREQTLANQSRVASEAADILGATVERVIQALERRLQLVERRFNNNQQLRNNAQG